VTEQNSYSLEHIGFKGKAVRGPKSTQSRGANRISGIEHEPLHAFVGWVLASAELPADAYRTAPMHRRFPSCLRTLRAASVSEAWSLMQNPQSVAKAIDSFIIGVTEYFRDRAVFDALRNFIATNFSIQQNPIRIWSAGCSNGAELCSLAILLAEAGLLENSILVGTDCRASAIQEARSGLYRENTLRSLDASLRQKYMRKAGKQWQVLDSLSRYIRWRVRNLISGCENGPWDVILWRNMAFYLKPETAMKIWDALIKEMRPGGLLVVGKAERPPVSAGLTCISRSIYQLQQ
jgi:chemotaxis protein methyltransferase CheR